jgi:hypothetical protein
MPARFAPQQANPTQAGGKGHYQRLATRRKGRRRENAASMVHVRVPTLVRARAERPTTPGLLEHRRAHGSSGFLPPPTRHTIDAMDVHGCRKFRPGHKGCLHPRDRERVQATDASFRSWCDVFMATRVRNPYYLAYVDRTLAPLPRRFAPCPGLAHLARSALRLLARRAGSGHESVRKAAQSKAVLDRPACACTMRA